MEPNGALPISNTVELSPQQLLKNGYCPLEQSYVEPEFTNISSAVHGGSGGGQGDVELRVGRNPKRVLHFSDGTLEEYTSDEEEVEQVDSSRTVSTVDPKTLPWKSWIWYQTAAFGMTSLKVCDYVGESLASFFGITTPKYQYEIDEYNRIMEEEEAEKKKQDVEMRGWKEENGPDTVHTNESTEQRY